MSNRVIHFEIQADDIERAKKFYEKTFDWKIEQMMKKEEGGMDYWGLTTGPNGTPGINGGLYKRTQEDAIHTFDCTVLVENIDKTIEDIRKNGGMITREKSELKGVGFFAQVEDPEGNRFGVMQATDWKPN